MLRRVLEVHSLQLLGLVGCFICVSGSWFCQIICTRFPNTFDTVPATAASPPSPWEIILHTYAHRTLDRASNEPCYWIEKYLRHSTFCAKIQFYFFIFRRKSAIKRAHTHSSIRAPRAPLVLALVGAESSVWLAGRTPVPANWKAGAVNSALHFICIWRRRWASVLPDSPVRASTVATGSRGVPSVSIERHRDKWIYFSPIVIGVICPG